MYRVSLDTNIIIPVLRGDATMLRHMEDELVASGSVHVSMVVRHELLFGAYASQNPAKSLATIERFFRVPNVVVEAPSPEDFEMAANLRATTRKRGREMALADAIIAAQALNNRLGLVTNDQDFRAAEGLKLVNWGIL